MPDGLIQTRSILAGGLLVGDEFLMFGRTCRVTSLHEGRRWLLVMFDLDESKDCGAITLDKGRVLELIRFQNQATTN